MRSRPASMASRIWARPMSPARSPSPITGSHQPLRARRSACCELRGTELRRAARRRLSLRGAADASASTPYAAVQAQDFHTPAYSETDVTGGGFGLSYARDERNRYAQRSRRALRRSDVVAGMPLMLRARVAWAHDWVTDPALSAAFETLPGASFTVNGAAIPQNSALTSAGAELFLTAALDAARQVRRRVRRRLADLCRLRHAALYVVTPIFGQCTLAAPHCTEVSQQSDVVGRSRHFERAQATSAYHPVADISVHRSAARQPTG